MPLSLLDLPLASIHPALQPATPHLSEITPHILQQASEIYFRQSLINDYLGCPHRTLYRWIAGFEEESTTFAAYYGTAGHKVIYDWHAQRRSDADLLWTSSAFQKAFYDELNIRQIQPRIGKEYQSLHEQFQAEQAYYVELLLCYMRNTKNREFHSTMHEQSFVLVVQNPRYTRWLDTHPTADEKEKRDMELLYPAYLFTGQIDQGGYYDDGTFALRDIKFRDKHFKPSRKELQLNTQLTVYAAAVKWGFPACMNCRPHYEEDQFTKAKKLHYNGPCDACKAKIATPQWPLRYAERCELVWMYDFETYKKDEHEKEILDRIAPKVRNGQNRVVFAKKVNPDWVGGYKKGDQKGEGILRTYRTQASLDVLLGDVLKICDDIRAGRFYRRPSSQCNWCPHQEACQTSLKIEVDQIDYAKIQTFGTEDPF